jgi:hypothetical protein
MVRRNVKNIEALEKLEEEKCLERERVNANTVATSEPIETSSSFILGDFILSPFY